MGVGGLIASLISKKSSAEELAQVYIVAFKKDGAEDNDIGVWAFQYWPESVQITQDANYATKDIIGGSHPLRQFLSLGDRIMSFQAEFSRDLQGEISDPSFVEEPGKIARGRFNVDIAAAHTWLESLKLPKYGPATSLGEYEPPPLLWVVFPNSRFGMARGFDDPFQSLMVSCTINVDSWFPDGTIRHSRVDLAFAEVVQTAAGIKFFGRNHAIFEIGKAGGPFWKFPVAKRTA